MSTFVFADGILLTIRNCDRALFSLRLTAMRKEKVIGQLISRCRISRKVDRFNYGALGFSYIRLPERKTGRYYSHGLVQVAVFAYATCLMALDTPPYYIINKPYIGRKRILPLTLAQNNRYNIPDTPHCKTDIRVGPVDIILFLFCY